MSRENMSASPPVRGRRYVTTRSRDLVRAKKKKKSYFDYSLLFVIIFMLVFGLLMLYSTSAYNAAIEFGDSSYYLKKQLTATCLGIAVMLVVSFLDYRKFVWSGVVIYAVSIVALFLVLTPLGMEFNGARRWINVGISIQPAEIAKLGVIIFLAVLVSNNRQRLDRVTMLIKLFAVSLFPAAIIYFVTDNMSSALIVAGIAFIMLFVASPKYSYFVLAAALGVAGIVGLLTTGNGFRGERFQAWQNPEKFASGKGFQTLQSLYAIGSGGLTGKGLGQSVQKLGYVPEAQNDMVFSIICEELGLFGGIAVIILFLIMIWRFMVIANNAEDLFGSMLVIGVMAHISIQVILNIAVVTNTIPNTGITLPFISYGGTSILFLLTEMGMVLSVSRQIKLE